MNVQMTRVPRVCAQPPDVKSSSEDELPRNPQPYLHELVTAVRAPAVALSAADGQIRSGAHGVYWADRRLVSKLVVRVDGIEPASVQATADTAGRVRFLGVVRDLGDRTADPTVFLERSRTVVAHGVIETAALVSKAREPFCATLEVQAAADLAGMTAVKGGRAAARLLAQGESDGLTWRADDGTVIRLRAKPEPDAIDPSSGTLRWSATLDRGERLDVTLTADIANEPSPPMVHLADRVDLADGLVVRSGDHRLSALVERGLADVRALVVADPLNPSDQFLAAGAPWFLTLFGRDAIWAARMLLPVGTDLAGGTLRTLARRQGTIVDTASAQEPGKIMHEIRGKAQLSQLPDRTAPLPSLYYGSVDATSLWVSLLHDAWRWGMAGDEVAALLPAADAAMDWLMHRALGASGFVSYRDESGQGLANQGWKDSWDSVQFRDGTLADPPIALCEVQGYAYAAARHAADLFDAFDRPGGQRLRGWADELADRFRRSFWVDGPDGRYPAIALDAAGRRVDAVTSNIGHLLGTGLLSADEESLIIARLGARDMDSGYGLRTMSSGSRGFNPLAYHGGSVWTHDTAIAIAGLAACGDPAGATVAGSLLGGLLAAAPTFDYRLPELFGGHARDENPTAVAYPAACRPQAWSAAAGVAMLAALLGVRADVPGGSVRIAPMVPSPVGDLDVSGLSVGGRRLDVHVRADGSVDVRTAPTGLRVALG
jgi:glycogen debranching enzyme